VRSALWRVLLLVCFAANASAQSEPELRGLWVVRTGLVSPAAVDAVLDQASAGGINALFVQVRGRGDAFYVSRTSPRSVLLERQPAQFDPFARLIEGARARGMQVHAWVNILLSAHFGQPLPAGHVLREHPDWVMVPRSVASAGLAGSRPDLLERIARAARAEGDAEGYYLSPSAPGVPEYLEGVVREVVSRYPVDGVHLDFVRYPSPEYDYSRAALEAFHRLRGGHDLPAAGTAAWDEYRRSALTRVVERLVAAARAARPGIVVSGAVVADETQAVGHKFQAWPEWVSHGLFDALCPMAYTPDTRLFRQQVERARSLSGSAGRIWAGIGAYRLSVEGIVEKVAAARQVGVAGVVLFSHESLSPADWPRLRQQAFPDVVRAAGEAAGAPGAAAPVAPR
jgi:uncharacterized lipoprotein YddW (UPF0748 family)